MRNLYVERFRLFLLNCIIIFTLFSLRASGQCSVNVSLSINGQGPAINVHQGALLKCDFSYTIGNPSNCSSCIDQLMVGIGTQYLACLFNGIPSVCPTLKAGNFSTTIIAPPTDGTYTFYYSTSQDYNCNPGSYKTDHAIGTVTVGQDCPLTVTINMNGAGNAVSVNPGSQVNMQFNYSISNANSCPTCIDQILLGVENQYLGCIFSGVAKLCPSASTGTYNVNWTAPGSGTYRVYFNTSQEYECKPANYKQDHLLGTIKVNQPIVEKPIVPVTDNRGVIATNSGNSAISDGNRYFALIIGVSNYQDNRLNLDRPEQDAKALHDILVSRYTFEDSTVTLMLSPTREQILEQLFQYRKKLGPSDNLLIFYAGHGYFDKDADQGYWWPADARPNNPANWLSNSDLREQIKSIKSLHTLLISDACFSGGIFKVRDVSQFVDAPNDIQQLYKMPSRRAMTSGTLTTVPDKSAFLEYLDKNLFQNNDKYLTSQDLFYKMRSAVIGNSPVVPQTGIIYQAGDEGGDFVFVLKSK